MFEESWARMNCESVYHPPEDVKDFEGKKEDE